MNTNTPTGDNGNKMLSVNLEKNGEVEERLNEIYEGEYENPRFNSVEFYNNGKENLIFSLGTKEISGNSKKNEREER